MIVKNVQPVETNMAMNNLSFNFLNLCLAVFTASIKRPDYHDCRAAELLVLLFRGLKAAGDFVIPLRV